MFAVVVASSKDCVVGRAAPNDDLGAAPETRRRWRRVVHWDRVKAVGLIR